MLNKFGGSRVPYVSQHFMSPPHHDALIGQWERWWNEDTIAKKNVRAIQPREAAYIKKKRGKHIHKNRRIADIMFLEKVNKKEFGIKGIAEIENDRKKLEEKVETLKSYEGTKLSGKTRYPCLRFGVLCTVIKLRHDSQDGFVMDNNVWDTYYAPAIKKMIAYSQKSKMDWIFYALYSVPSSEEKSSIKGQFKDKDGAHDSYFWKRRYYTEGDFLVIRHGKIIRCTSDILDP